MSDEQYLSRTNIFDWFNRFKREQEDNKDFLNQDDPLYQQRMEISTKATLPSGKTVGSANFDVCEVFHAAWPMDTKFTVTHKYFWLV